VKRNAFSHFHPIVNFLFFAGAIGFGVLFQHPAYLLASLCSASVYYFLLKRKKALNLIAGMIPVLLLIAFINPLFNTYGKTVLFFLLDRPYTLEALCHGGALGTMFILMMLWFSCYNEVLTSDKFVCLFGNFIPSLSLLLIMVLRLIPSFMRKTRQIIDARNSIGKGGSKNAAFGEKALSGMMILSALTDWALEGSIVTADSMRARGYGSTKRTSFQTYRMSTRDWALMIIEIVLAAIIMAVAFTGAPNASFTPALSIPDITWGYAAYWTFVLIPIIVELKETLQWHTLISKI
jgi:energy-coupling factor transport system permease protein